MAKIYLMVEEQSMQDFSKNRYTANYISQLYHSVYDSKQRLYQDNYLPFKRTETDEGEVRSPMCPPLYSFARLVYPVTLNLLFMNLYEVCLQFQLYYVFLSTQPLY